MTMEGPDRPPPNRKSTSIAATPAAPDDLTADWTARRWGSAVAAAVYVEMRRGHPAALSGTDPALRRAVEEAIQREVAKAIERVRADAATGKDQA